MAARPSTTITQLPDGLRPGEVRITPVEGRPDQFLVEKYRSSGIPKKSYWGSADLSELIRKALDMGIKPALAPVKQRSPRAKKPAPASTPAAS